MKESELTFDVELLEFKSRAEIEAMQKQMQEMQQQQGGQASGAPPAPEPTTTASKVLMAAP